MSSVGTKRKNYIDQKEEPEVKRQKTNNNSNETFQQMLDDLESDDVSKQQNNQNFSTKKQKISQQRQKQIRLSVKKRKLEDWKYIAVPTRQLPYFQESVGKENSVFHANNHLSSNHMNNKQEEKEGEILEIEKNGQKEKYDDELAKKPSKNTPTLQNNSYQQEKENLSDKGKGLFKSKIASYFNPATDENDGDTKSTRSILGRQQKEREENTNVSIINEEPDDDDDEEDDEDYQEEEEEEEFVDDEYDEEDEEDEDNSSFLMTEMLEMVRQNKKENQHEHEQYRNNQLNRKDNNSDDDDDDKDNSNNSHKVNSNQQISNRSNQKQTTNETNHYSNNDNSESTNSNSNSNNNNNNNNSNNNNSNNNNHKTENDNSNDNKINNQIENQTKEKNQEEDDDEEEECPICLDDFPPTSMWSPSECSHRFCFECVKTYLDTKLKDNKFPVKCPQPKCNVELTLNDVKPLLNSKEIEKFDQVGFNSVIETNGDMFSCCPTPDCGYVFVWMEGDDPHFRCEICRRHYCLQCRCEYHHGMSCLQYRKSMISGGISGKAADRAFLAFVTGMKFKQCPQCKRWVEKAMGCNHMVCNCGGEFCYGCGDSFPCSCGQNPHV